MTVVGNGETYILNPNGTEGATMLEGVLLSQIVAYATSCFPS